MVGVAKARRYSTQDAMIIADSREQVTRIFLPTALVEIFVLLGVTTQQFILLSATSSEVFYKFWPAKNLPAEWLINPLSSSSH